MGASTSINISNSQLNDLILQLCVRLTAEQVENLSHSLSASLKGIDSTSVDAAFNAALSRLADGAIDNQASAYAMVDRMHYAIAYLRALPTEDVKNIFSGRQPSLHAIADFLAQRRRDPRAKDDSELFYATGLIHEAILDLGSSQTFYSKAVEISPENTRFAKAATESCLFCGEFFSALTHGLHWYDLVKDDAALTDERVQALNCVGAALIEQGEWLQGFQSIEMAAQEAKQSSDSSLLSLSLNNLGAALNLLGLYSKAEVALREALAIREMSREPVKNVALTFNNLSSTCRNLDRLDEAEDLLRSTKALLHRELPVTLGSLLPPIYAQTLNNLGSLQLIELADACNALESFEQALSSLRMLPDWAPNVAITLHNIAYAHVKKGECDRAAEYYRRAYRGAKRLYGIRDERTLHIKSEAEKYCGKIISSRLLN